MAAKKKGKKKALPTWVSVVVVVIVLAGVVVFYVTRQSGGDVNAYRKIDPEAVKMQQEFEEQCHDINFFKTRVRGDAYAALVARKVIPPEWAEGNYVPYYDPKKASK
jgi:hypothetical protein